MKHNMTIRPKRKKKSSYVKVILIGIAIILLVALAITAILLAQTCNKEPPSADGDLEFFPIDNETMYAYYDHDSDGKCDDGATIRLRATPETDGEIKHTLLRGTSVTRIGVYYDNGSDGAGWSKVIFEGEICYTRNSCLAPINPNAIVETTTE